MFDRQLYIKGYISNKIISQILFYNFYVYKEEADRELSPMKP